MTGIHAMGTVCYRLLIEPDLGPTLGNTVFVGLDVQHARQREDLLFSGLPNRVTSVRRALDAARIFDGDRFDTAGRATAEELRSAIRNRAVQLFEPILVRGEEILDQLNAPE